MLSLVGGKEKEFGGGRGVSRSTNRVMILGAVSSACEALSAAEYIQKKEKDAKANVRD